MPACRRTASSGGAIWDTAATKEMKAIPVRLARLVALILVTSATLFAEQTPLERANLARRGTLAGLDGVRVVVEELNFDDPAKGLTSALVQTDMKLRLRQSGIRVLEQSELARAPGFPILTLQIVLLPLSTAPGLYAFDAHLDLEQVVQLTRDSTKRLSAVTWSTTGTIGVVGANQVSSLRATARDLIRSIRE